MSLTKVSYSMIDGAPANVRSFGAVGDGVADDTAAIQAAINSGAKRVVGVRGDIYRITDSLTIDVNSLTLDLYNANIRMDDATGIKSHLIIGNGTTQRNGIIICNITFSRTQAATAGYAIELRRIGVSEISGCRIFGDNKIYNGIKINPVVILNIFNNYIDNCLNYGIYIEGLGTGADRTVDVSIRETRIDGCVNAINTWDFVEGLFCRDNIFYAQTAGSVTCNASSNANGLASFKFQENDFDSAGGSGLVLENINNIQVTGCWFSANGNRDIAIGANVTGCVIVGNQMYPNPAGKGIEVAGRDARITGNLISGGDSAIDVLSTARRTGISGNTIENANNGIVVNALAENTSIAANLFSNMITGVISGGGTNGNVQANAGDSTAGSGAYITVGASPFTHTAASRPECVSIFEGTVSNISLGANTIGLETNRDIMLAPGQSVTVTYSSVPFMYRNRL